MQQQCGDLNYQEFVRVETIWSCARFLLRRSASLLRMEQPALADFADETF